MEPCLCNMFYIDMIKNLSRYSNVMFYSQAYLEPHSVLGTRPGLGGEIQSVVQWYEVHLEPALIVASLCGHGTSYYISVLQCFC